MKLVLTFVHPSKPAKTVGPFEAVRFDGDTVRDPVQRALIGRHLEHQWEVEGKRYFRLDCPSRVRIHFEQPRLGTASREFGPYERFSAVDGIAYTDERVFAFVDPKVGDWFCYNDGQHWPIMIVTDAPPGVRPNVLGFIAALAPLLAGVIGLWKRGELLYLGRAASIRDRLLALLQEGSALGADELSAIGWEAHRDPAAREAELLAEYRRASHQLVL